MLFCLFFGIVFCGIYNQTRPGWVNSIMLDLITDWFIISLILPILKTIIRIVVRTCPKLYCLVYVEHLFFISDFIGC